MHAQRDDPLLSKIIYALESNMLPTLPDLPVSPSQFHLHEGLLIRRPPADNTPYFSLQDALFFLKNIM